MPHAGNKCDDTNRFLFKYTFTSPTAGQYGTQLACLQEIPGVYRCGIIAVLKTNAHLLFCLIPSLKQPAFFFLMDGRRLFHQDMESLFQRLDSHGHMQIMRGTNM